MSFLGDRAVGSTITHWFTTKINGVPTDLAGSPAISIYKTGSDTQVTTGVTLTQPYDATTGLNKLVIDTSSDGTFYARGNDFSAVLTAGTLGGVSQVGEVVMSFSLGLGNVDYVKSTLQTAGDLAALINTVDDFIDTEVSAIKTQTDKFVFTVANKVDANVLNVAGTAASATNLGKTTAAIGRGTVAALSTTTSIITSAFSPAGISIDQFKGRVVLFDIDTTTTALRGQARTITGSTAVSLAVLTVDALTDAPVSGDTFSIV